MRKWLSFLLFVVVLRVPLGVWLQIPESERARIRLLTISDYCKEDMKKGRRVWNVNEQINDYHWELHIVPVRQEL